MYDERPEGPRTGGGSTEEWTVRLDDVPTNVARVHLYDMNISEQDALRFRAAFMKNADLQSVSMDRCDMRPTALKSVATGLFQCRHRTLTEVMIKGSISDNHCKSFVDAARCSKMPELDCGPSSLQRLCLSYNRIGNTGAQHLSLLFTEADLQHRLRITVLDLSHNHIGDKGAASLTVALKTSVNLKELNLADNRLGPDGGTSLGSLIEGSTSLVSLLLSSNSIGAMGAVAIARALAKSSTLSVLDLRNNSIGDAGAEEIMCAAEKLEASSSTKLKHVLLAGNGAGRCTCSACRSAREGALGKHDERRQRFFT